MKFIEQLIKIPLKALYLWYWVIPIRFSVLAFAAYFGVMYLLYGSLYASDIQNVLEANGVGMFWGFVVPFVVPVFLSLGATFSGGGNPNASTSAIDDAIKFRNGQMNIAPPKKAAEILRKTAHLDVIQANKDSNDVFKNASYGFDAKYGISSPTKVFDDIMKND